jgi:DNA (cytosine-5)-methyltransferase 1
VDKSRVSRLLTAEPVLTALTVGSLFAGIGGFDLAAERADMEVAWQSENDPKASKVLAHHWPDIPNYGDIHKIGAEDGRRRIARVDVLCGGFPCQDYSIAGAGAGLAGDRGALWWEYHRLIAGLRPTWVVAENVPGLLSSRDGADFETIVGSLGELGYGVAWAVLDAQYFGVAQRRRRVFIVGHSGGVPRPEILALAEGLYGNPPPSRQARSGTTGATPIGVGGDSEVGYSVTGPSGGMSAKQNQFTFVIQPDDQGGQGALLAKETDVASSLLAREAERKTDRGVRVVYSEGGMENYQEVDTIHAMTADGPGSRRIEQIVFAQNQRDEVRVLNDLAGAINAEPGMKQETYVAKTAFTESNGWGILGDGTTHTVDSSGPEAVIQIGTPTIRRLTPLECERLQGFPDGWTDIPSNSVNARYRQLGNAVAVPVVTWILNNIAHS